MRQINEIILHCSLSKFGTQRLIDKWHRNPPNNWDLNGYHFVVLNGWSTSKLFMASMDGQIEVGRPLWKPGAHCYGKNRRSIGICLIGEYKFTLNQFNSVLHLCQDLITQHGPLKISGHNKYSNKSCPNFSVDALSYLIERNG